MVQKLRGPLSNKTICIRLTGATGTTLVSLTRQHVIEKVCGLEKSDMGETYFHLPVKEQTKDGFTGSLPTTRERRKHTSHLLQDVKIAGTGSPGLVRAAGAQQVHSVLTQTLRAP